MGLRAASATHNELTVALSKVGQRLGVIEDTLQPLARAVDGDAETLVNHGRRLTRVEEELRLDPIVSKPGA